MKSMVCGIHAAIYPPKAEQNTENTSATRKKARKLYFIRQRRISHPEILMVRKPMSFITLIVLIVRHSARGNDATKTYPNETNMVLNPILNATESTMETRNVKEANVNDACQSL